MLQNVVVILQLAVIIGIRLYQPQAIASTNSSHTRKLCPNHCWNETSVVTSAPAKLWKKEPQMAGYGSGLLFRPSSIRDSQDTETERLAKGV